MGAAHPHQLPANRRRRGAPPSGRERGISLVEAIVATAVSLVVIGAAVQLTGSVSGASHEIGTSLETTRTAVDALGAIRADIGRCRLDDASSDGAALTYSLPISAGPGGALLDSSGEIVWGVNDARGSKPGGTVTLSFALDHVLFEASSGVDVNGDGDQLDTYDVGRLVRTSSNGERMAFPPVLVVLKTGDHGADADGDGSPDPLFALAADSNEVTVRLLQLVDGKSLRSWETRCAVPERKP